MRRLLALLFLCFFSTQIKAQHIIPQPVEIQQLKSPAFRLTASTSIGGNTEEARTIAKVLANKISTATGYPFTIRQSGNIQLNLTKTRNEKIGDEGYTIEVSSKTVVITANKAAGLFYGMQSFIQLLPKEIESKTVIKAQWSVPSVQVVDYPRFAWRGLMLDVSRHFFSKEDVKHYIGDMVRYKYNVFHWHLTDDEGWRIEIKSLPKLTQVGACRVQRYGKWGTYEAPKDGEPATDCGFYTQDDIREIVAYATERHVTILPEIDVPGHSTAAIASYPELCCTKDSTIKVSPGHSFSEWYGNGQFKMLVDNALNPSDDKVYEFLDKVFTEVAALFPGQFIHTGGDECYHGYWEKDAGCQALMKKESLKNTHELQSYFVKRVEKIVKSKGKKLIGWDEILEGGLAPEASVMSWRGTEGGKEAAKQGHTVVMTPNDFTYIDLIQGDPLAEPDATSYKSVRLKKTYSYEPAEGIDTKFILGGEANLWSEKTPTLRHAQYLTYPRAWAMADILWSPQSVKNWDYFVKRMELQFERADLADINYARSVYDAIVQPSMKDNKLLVDMSTEINGLDIFYTIDETIPDKFSTKFTQPIDFPEGKSVTLKVVTYRNGKQVGKVIAFPREELKKRLKKQ